MIQICLLTFFWVKAKNVRFPPFMQFFCQKWPKMQNDIQIGWNLWFTLKFVLNFIENKPVFRAHFHTVKWTKSHIFGIIWEKSQLTDMLHHIFASGLVSYNICMIPLDCTQDLGYSNSGKALLQCVLLNSELVLKKFYGQISGIIQKSYETKSDANMLCSISVFSCG